MKRHLLTLLLLGTPALLPAADRIWTGAAAPNTFDHSGNYTPTGAFTGADRLIFNLPTSTTLALANSVYVGGVAIQNGANGFRLQSAGHNLVINSDGLSVAASTHATFATNVSLHGSASQTTFATGAGGSTTLENVLTPYNAKLIKTGAGTLTLHSGFGPSSENRLRTGSSFAIEEGTLQIGNSAIFAPADSSSFAGNYHVSLGTALTTATLRGGGSFAGTGAKPVILTTHGTSRSILEPAGDGSLEIQNLNAAAGATIRLTLGETFIFGSGTFTGSSAAGGLALDLSGGEVGTTYTLFDFANGADLQVSDFSILNSDYVVDTWNVVDGQVEVTFSAVAVPEPSLAGVAVALLLGGMAWRSRRNRK